MRTLKKVKVEHLIRWGYAHAVLEFFVRAFPKGASLERVFRWMVALGWTDEARALVVDACGRSVYEPKEIGSIDSMTDVLLCGDTVVKGDIRVSKRLTVLGKLHVKGSVLAEEVCIYGGGLEAESDFAVDGRLYVEGCLRTRMALMAKRIYCGQQAITSVVKAESLVVDGGYCSYDDVSVDGMFNVRNGVDVSGNLVIGEGVCVGGSVEVKRRLTVTKGHLFCTGEVNAKYMHLSSGGTLFERMGVGGE